MLHICEVPQAVAREARRFDLRDDCHAPRGAGYDDLRIVPNERGLAAGHQLLRKEAAPTVPGVLGEGFSGLGMGTVRAYR